MHTGDLAVEIIQAQGRLAGGMQLLQAARYLDEADAPVRTARRRVTYAYAKATETEEKVIIDDLVEAVEHAGNAVLNLLAAIKSMGVDPETVLPFVRESLKNGTALYLRQLVQTSVIQNVGPHAAPMMGVDAHGYTTPDPARLEKFDQEKVSSDDSEGEA